MLNTIDLRLSQLTTEELTGQLFCPATFIHDDDEGISYTERLITEHKVGGLTFFHSRASAATNYEKKDVPSYENSLQKLKELIAHYQSLSKTPLLISIDAEWGLAMRVEDATRYPYAITLGALSEKDDHLIYKTALQIGKDLKSVGVNYNLAPVADINTNPDNPVIGYRSFGASGEQVWRKAWQFCRGLSDSGIANCLKHFPGHGDTAVDSHLGLPVIHKNRKQLEAEELFPFSQLIAKGVDSIMVGHLAVPALSGDETTPATLSKKIIHNLLKNEMGFKGLVISDALNMHSVSKIYPEKGLLEQKAFEAGNDILCFSENTKEGIEKISENVDLTKIRESVKRIFTLKEKIGLFCDQKESNALDFPDTKIAISLNREIAEKSIIALRKTIPSGDTVIMAGDYHRENGFMATLNSSGRYSSIKAHNTLASLNVSTQIGVIICLFLPNIKPIENFGITRNNLQLINTLIRTHKTSVIVFGNPYFIQHITNRERAENIVLCGEDLREFQEVAAGYILGKVNVSGDLPFPLI